RKWMRRVFRDEIQLSPADHGDAIGTADPEIPPPVFKEFIDAVAGEALCGCKVGQFPKAPAVKAAGSSPEPQSAVGVFANGPNLLVPKCVGDRVFGKVTVLQMANAPISTDPNAA